MNRLVHKRNNTLRRAHRVRSVLKLSSGRPRLSVRISNRNVAAQIIDDDAKITLVSSSSSNQKASEKSTMSEKAAAVGKDIAKKAKAKKVTKVMLDRGPKLYHGRVKALADAAREEGLEF